MFSTAQSSHTIAPAPGQKRAPVAPRLVAFAAVGLLSLTACSNANGVEEPDAASSSPPMIGSSPAQESSAPESGAITEGAADEAWREQARQAAADHNSVDPTACLDTLLDQKTLDGVATALPDVGGMYLSGLFTDAGCLFTGANDPNEWGAATDHVAAVEIRRYYLANDDLGGGHALDESGFLKHDQCADDVETNENGVATIHKHGVRESTIHGGSTPVDLQAAWHCSEDGATTSAVLIHAADGEEDGFSDPGVLTKPDLAVEMTTQLSAAESGWAPQMDEIYKKDFKDIKDQ